MLNWIISSIQIITVIKLTRQWAGACGIVWGENTGHPALTCISSYLTIPGGEGERGGDGVKEKERKRGREKGVRQREGGREMKLGACWYITGCHSPSRLHVGGGARCGTGVGQTERSVFHTCTSKIPGVT